MKAVYTHELVANQIESGLTTPILRSMGESRTSVNYFMNVDEDFISDVLSCYNG